MFYPYGFGFGSHWLLYVGVPLIIGIWAQIRVTSAFRKWGEVRASSNITGGLFFRISGLITLGIYCYLVLLVFQLITLPVEFDASRRAKIILQQMGIVRPGEEVVGVNKVLNAAALTYIAAFIAALGNLLWLMSIRDRR